MSQPRICRKAGDFLIVFFGYSTGMPVKTPKHRRKRSTTSKPKRLRGGVSLVQRGFRKSWRASRTLLKALRASPLPIKILAIPMLGLLLGFGGNWAYQTFQKPTEVFFPLDRYLSKHPGETWRQYQSLFREHGTATITPEFLAALAQVEGSGNPVARTYWRWQWTWNPLNWYQPASSAVGMYQITDGTFQEASRYCIHDHLVVDDGPWHDWDSCWFNTLYTRVLPSHAIEMTAALLDRRVSQALTSHGPRSPSLRQKQNLAAVIHLCGFGAGKTYASRNFRSTPNQHCGDHRVKAYLSRINALKFGFEKPGAGDKTIKKAK